MKDARSDRLSGIMKSIGPGILYAGAAIGGSHLLWSTQAGALYGWKLLWIIVLVNVFKYPFFEFTQRYTAVTGEAMLVGYRRVGNWTLWCFALFALASAVLNVAGVTVLAGVLAGELFGVALTPFWWSAILFAVCVGILAAGRYALLDLAMRIIMGVLAVSTIAAFAMAASHGSNAQPNFEAPALWNAVGIAFMLKLMGWMPSPIDVGVWPSLWAVERRKQTGHRATLTEALVDFHIGYVGSGVMALFFLGLGAYVMYGTGEDIGTTGAQFAKKLIELYTRSLGGWSFYIVATAAFTCMFSTALTCVDGYTRTLHASLLLCMSMPESRAEREDPLFWGIMAFVVGSALLAIGISMKAILGLLGAATVAAFLSAPILAYLNYRVITDSHVPAEGRPPRWLLALAWAGMVFLTGFALLYLYMDFLAAYSAAG